MSGWQPRYDPDAHERRARSGQPPQGYHPGMQPQYQQQPPTWPQQQPPQYQQPGPAPQYPPQGRRQPPRRKGGKGKVVAGIIGGTVLLIVVISVAASHGSPQAPAATGTTPPAPSQAAPPSSHAAAAAPATVTYVVTGSSADVTYGPAGSSLSGSVPMRKTDKLGSKPAAYYSIDAQLSGGGKVTCEIMISGKVISKATATGGYNIASCEISQDPFSGQWQDTNAA